METSLFLAKLLGPLLLVAGMGVVLNRAAYREVAEEVIETRALLYLFGIVALSAGLAIVLTHNEWVWGWPVIVTILGWLLMIRGAVRVLFPHAVGDLGTRTLARSPNLVPAGGAFGAVLGAVLCFFGYFA